MPVQPIRTARTSLPEIAASIAGIAQARFYSCFRSIFKSQSGYYKRVQKCIILITMDEPILHYELHCKGCGAPILLPKGMIGWLFADPDAQPNRSHAIAVVCRLCKSVDTYFLDKNHPRHNLGYLVKFADPIRDSMDGPMLGCGEEGCQALVPLFAQWTPDATKEERKADVETWRWGHLQCPAGHSIAKPVWALS